MELSELKNLLQRYVDDWTAPDTSTVGECLQAVSQQERYELIATVKHRCGFTAIHWAAWHDHTELVNCLLHSVTQEQCYQLMKIQGTGDLTAIHHAALRDHPHIIQCILRRLTSDQQLHLLNIQSVRNRTALEYAQLYNSESAVAVLQQYRSAAEPVIQQRQLTDKKITTTDRRKVTARVERLEEGIVQLKTQVEVQAGLLQAKDTQIDGQGKTIAKLETKATTAERQLRKLGANAVIEKRKRRCLEVQVVRERSKRRCLEAQVVRERGKRKVEVEDLAKKVKVLEQQSQETAPTSGKEIERGQEDRMVLLETQSELQAIQIDELEQHGQETREIVDRVEREVTCHDETIAKILTQ